MANFQWVSFDRFSLLTWQRDPGYGFAHRSALAAILAPELVKASLSLPICLQKNNAAWQTCAIQSFEPDSNLFLAPDGRWIGPYIPAQYRAYPFALARVEDNRYALCVDMDSGLVGEGFEHPFFEQNGELAKPVKDVLNFLQQVEKSRELTLRLCAALDAEGLIVPWEITVKGKGGEKKIAELYRIDEARLNSLDSEALYRLHQAGALPVAYCQLLSMQHIHTLAKLADAHAKIEAAQPHPEKPNGQSGVSFLGDDGKIDFSGFN